MITAAYIMLGFALGSGLVLCRRFRVASPAGNLAARRRIKPRGATYPKINRPGSSIRRRSGIPDRLMVRLRREEERQRPREGRN